jgi:glyoxylase-like metal-dependent hydrolase (beta-lactamase superfamily II)
MQRERVADDIYIFTSEQYAQVTASVILTDRGAVLIDTLMFPDETRAIKAYIEGRLHYPIRYVINTHYHADHTYGTYLFPEALVISHALCFDLLNTRGRAGLEQAQQSTSEFADVRLVLPHYVFLNGIMTVSFGNKTLQMWHTPGHSPDSMVCLAREDRILFAADTLMPVPHFVDGDYDTFIDTLNRLQTFNRSQSSAVESIVQGHGEIVLKGEIDDKITGDLAYLRAVKQFVELARDQANPEAYLDTISIEQCGKSRLPLNGSVRDLHRSNLHALYRQLKAKSASTSVINA